MKLGDREWVLDRFAFAAVTIAEWLQLFGRDTAQKMVFAAVTNKSYSKDLRDAFRAAFGM